MILIVAWHVVPRPLLVSATVAISGSAGSTEDPGKTCLCDLKQVIELLRDSADLYSSSLAKPLWWLNLQCFSERERCAPSRVSVNVNFFPVNLHSFSFPNFGVKFKKELRKAENPGVYP